MKGINEKQDALYLASVCGCRRSSLVPSSPTAVTANDAVRNEQGQIYAFHLLEKGGKERTALVLPSEQKNLTNRVDNKLKNGHSPEAPLILNELAKRIENLSDYDANKLGAVLEYEGCCSVETVVELLDNLDNFDLVTGVTDDETLGYYYAEELGSIDIPEHLKNYMDYEAYGRNIRLESSCLYTLFGFLLDNR